MDPKGLKTRDKIVAGAARGFRSHGYGGVGVDALAKSAGVTSGAFYGHFESKADVFREVTVLGLEELRAAIDALQRESPEEWQRRFIDFYLGERRTCSPEETCALQSLLLDIARAEPAARAAFEAEWIRIRDTAAAGMAGSTETERRARATALLALLSGAVSIARAVRRPELSKDIATDVKRFALAIAGDEPRERPAGRGSRRHGPGVDEAPRPALVDRLEDAWNSHDPVLVTRACSEACHWRDRSELLEGRAEILAFLERRRAREFERRTIHELWAREGRRMTVRVASEWRDDSGHWFRTLANELWELDDAGDLSRRDASANDCVIDEVDRLLTWPLGPRPSDHPTLSQLGL